MAYHNTEGAAVQKMVDALSHTMAGRWLFRREIGDECLSTSLLACAMAKLTAESTKEAGEVRFLGSRTFISVGTNEVGICFAYKLGEGETVSEWEDKHSAHFRAAFGDHYRCLHYGYGEPAVKLFLGTLDS